MRRDQEECQRDEWPPAEFWQAGAGQYIRYNHREDNSGAGKLWERFCPGMHPGLNPLQSLTVS